MIVFANRYFYDRLGFVSGSLLGQNLVSVLTPASRIVFDSFMLPMLKHKGNVEEIQLEVINSDEERIPVVVNAVLDEAEGEFIYWSVFLAVQRNKLYKELIQTRELAENASKAKSRFLSSMSHELRTPMNAILGFSQVIKDDTSLSESQQSYVDEIINAGNHLLELINGILDLARVEAGRIDISLETVQVNTAIEEALKLVQPLADKRAIHCRLASTEVLYLRADPTRLKQVLLNLISNAIKYNRSGGTVDVEARRVHNDGDPRVRISVIDTGPGIAPEDLPGLITPFNRLKKESSDVEGTGIGLTITRQIVQAMDGTMDFTSEVGVGSTFWIELPERQPEESALEAQVAKPAVKPEVADTTTSEPGSDIVLYIEDNPVNLKLVEHFLRRHGRARMVPAETPQKGIELASTLKPTIILLDLSMPDMDGFQVLEILKTKPELEGTPIIAMTAYALPEDIQRGKAAGFDDYLTKPIKLGHFCEVLDLHLNKVRK